MSRLTPFTGIDGESINDNYCLLSTQHKSIESFPRLTTDQCLKFIMSLDGLIVGFSFHFDACHILRDLPPDKLKAALHAEDVTYKSFKIKYIPRKMLIVSQGGRKKTIYDVWGFFQKSFIGAAESLGFKIPDEIRQGKAARGKFTRAEFEAIKSYNTLECVMLADMMHEFRERIRKNFVVRSWHGAGAISQGLLKQWAPIHDDMDKLDIYARKIKDAFDSSFYGGRIELMKVGTLKGLHCYDINSAYPAALANVPQLPQKFTHVREYAPDRVGVYYIEWDWTSAVYKNCPIAPFPVRNNGGLITYPLTGEGWITSYEVDAAVKYLPSCVTVREGYVFKPKSYPYKNLVLHLYETRKELKRIKDGAQIGYKLGLNSLYGKLAQQGGAYHHPILKTFITGQTRATMFTAALQAPSKIVSFATDGIVSTVPLDLPVSDVLGEFEYAPHDKGLFIMSGIYKLDEDTRKVRGFKKLDIEECARSIDETGAFSISFDSFVSPLLASETVKPYTFHTFTKKVNIYDSIKRDYEFLHYRQPHKHRSLLKDVWESSSWYNSSPTRTQVKRQRLDFFIED